MVPKSPSTVEPQQVARPGVARAEEEEDEEAAAAEARTEVVVAKEVHTTVLPFVSLKASAAKSVSSLSNPPLS
jgi:hypothetical protein